MDRVIFCIIHMDVYVWFPPSPFFLVVCIFIIFFAVY